jgi:PHD/YefM family antitoxin component YafN of YafNO toxin-antitoxin module
MVALKSLEFVTDSQGKKRKILLSVTDFDKMQEEMEDLEDALTLEKAKKGASGFKKWTDFIKEINTVKKV